MSETPLIGGGAESSNQPSPSGSQSPKKPGDGPVKRRFMNGWSKEQDDLMADWADIAGCYRWMHDKAEKKYTFSNMGMTIPVIILSTLTGTANVGLSSISSDPEIQKYLTFGIGGLSLIAGIMTTLNNFLRFAQLSESNRVAGVAWGKFQRLIAVELALNPNERMDSLDFLKICRADLDRLIEQSPPIPDDVIKAFETEFKDNKSLRRPDICHGLEHTRIFNSKETRLRQLTSEAALFLLNKKKMMRQEIIPDLNKMITSAVEDSLERKKTELEEEISKKLMASKPKLTGGASTLFSVNETDFQTILEQRKRVVEFAKTNPLPVVIEGEAPPENVMIDVKN